MPNASLIESASNRVIGLMDGFHWPDATTTLSSELGGAPLEDGRQVTDHYSRRQDVHSLIGSVTDMNGRDITVRALQELQRLHREGRPLEILLDGGERIWPECLIVRAVEVQRGLGYEIQLEVQEVLRVRVGQSPTLTPATTAGPALGRAGGVRRGRVALTVI